MPIFDARIMLNVTSPAQWAARQAKILRRPVRVPETVVTDPMVARIEQNRWLFDCYCGGSVAVQPDWTEARCLSVGCGRVYTNVRIPVNRSEIEGLLLVRPKDENRNWDPRRGDTAQTLRDENDRV